MAPEIRDRKVMKAVAKVKEGKGERRKRRKKKRRRRTRRRKKEEEENVRKRFGGPTMKNPRR